MKPRRFKAKDANDKTYELIAEGTEPETAEIRTVDKTPVERVQNDKGEFQKGVYDIHSDIPGIDFIRVRSDDENAL